MAKFTDIIHSLIKESDEPAVLVMHELETFLKKHKKDFDNVAEAKKTLKDIAKETDDIKLISLVGKFFGYLETPDFHEEFINHIMGLL